MEALGVCCPSQGGGIVEVLVFSSSGKLCAVAYRSRIAIIFEVALCTEQGVFPLKDEAVDICFNELDSQFLVSTKMSVICWDLISRTTLLVETLKLYSSPRAWFAESDEKVRYN